MSEKPNGAGPDCGAWLRKLCEEFVKLELRLPVENLLPEDGLPKWVQNLEREVGSALYPVAKIKEDLNLTPRKVGAILGHACACGVWMMEAFTPDLESQAEIDVSRFTPEQLERAELFLQHILEEWFPALRRLAKRALCSSVDQTYENMSAFLLGYSEAFSRKPRQLGMGDIGNSAFPIHFFMLIHWQFANSLKSVHELHQHLVRILGPHRVGDLKRVEKICQRVGLHYRKPGRPKKAA